MKRIIGVFAIVLGTAAALYAQEKKGKNITPSKEVKAGFEKKFPGATNVKWEQEGADFEAGFKQKGEEVSAVFDKNGSLKETETEIATAKLPASVTSYLQKHYAGQKVKEAAKIVKADGTVNYEAEINKMDVLFDASGNFLKETRD